MNAAEYRDYLRSEHWQETRELALYHAQHRCQSPWCKLADLRSLTNEELAVERNEWLPPNAYRLEVHHITYDRLGHEDPDDLIVLCPRCHADVHGINYTYEAFSKSPEADHTKEPFSKSMEVALTGAIRAIERAFNALPEPTGD